MRASVRPFVAAPRQEPVEQRDERRKGEERPDGSGGTEEGELPEVRDDGHERAEDEAARPRVGRRAGVGDHEEGEEEQASALELVDGNRERIAEPKRAGDEEHGPRREEREGHVGAERAMDDEAAGAREGEGQEGRRPPLPRRDPGRAARKQHGGGEAEVRGVEDVLAPHAQHELAPDREHGRARGEGRRGRPEEQAERKARDERAAGIEARKASRPPEYVLGEEADPDEEGRPGRSDVEVQDEETEGEQSRERRDVVRTRIHVAATSGGALSFRRGGPPPRAMLAWRLPALSGRRGGRRCSRQWRG